ncbi:hypothetical protein HHI36_014163 [Cryptolaemus montrouzieri]|uniref:Uncharacterized protein n=1 Tax=Cryptolaemus montrouzieri TaxID=559131 RepID=A0ABD2N230_9CUCU
MSFSNMEEKPTMEYLKRRLNEIELEATNILKSIRKKSMEIDEFYRIGNEVGDASKPESINTEITKTDSHKSKESIEAGNLN